MKKIHTVPDTIQAGYLKSILEQRGIQCVLKNEYLGGGIGELPINECWPEIWVIDPRDEKLAKELISNHRQPAHGESWTCQHCGERLEPQFTDCWRCQTADEN